MTLNTGYYESSHRRARFTTRDTTFTAQARFGSTALRTTCPYAGNPANQIPGVRAKLPVAYDDSPLVQNGAIAEGVGSTLNMAGLTIRGGFTGGNITIYTKPTEGFVEVGSFKSVNGALGFMLREATVNLASGNNDWSLLGLYHNISLLKCCATNVMAAHVWSYW